MKPAAAIRAIFVAQFISVIGDRIFMIALAWWVVSQPDLPHREFTLGLLLAVSTLPVVLSGPLLGRIIDRIDKRYCMLAADFGRLVLVVALAVLTDLDLLSVPLLFVLCVPLFGLAPLFDAAVSASLAPLADSPPMLSRLVALESGMPHAGQAFGSLFGALALAASGVAGAFWFNAVSFLISFLLIARLFGLRLKGHQPATTDPGGSYAFLKDLPNTKRLLLIFGALNFFLRPSICTCPCWFATYYRVTVHNSPCWNWPFRLGVC